MYKVKNIIVQAGGVGSRLETLTLNRPKALVPIDNRPLLFHLFTRFPEASFTIIADYRADVLKKYLEAFADVDYRVLVANKKGTCSGIRQAVADFGSAPFLIIWCDLILPDGFFIPAPDRNYIGISRDFECRWSYRDGSIIKEPSKEYGIAGLFHFRNKSELEGVPEEGEFVRWLQGRDNSFEPLAMHGTREIGTMMSYQENETSQYRCRPFNRMEFTGERVIKMPVTEDGHRIAEDECNWYKAVQEAGYSAVPRIYGYNPLQMEFVRGEHVFRYTHFTKYQKQEILRRIIRRIQELHGLLPFRDADADDCYENYVGKTFSRLSQVYDLVPFAKDPFIQINGRSYRNIFEIREEVEEMIRNHYPRTFSLIHGDVTFSNLLLRTEDVEPVLIDPRGYFGKTKLYGDPDYDWAKLYYSVVGDYDQFNRKNFSLEIGENGVSLEVISNGWKDMEGLFFEMTGAHPEKIRLLHALIWLSLTTYAWEDYDSICGAFYRGIVELEKVFPCSR